jgi:hypothetical protein
MRRGAQTAHGLLQTLDRFAVARHEIIFEGRGVAQPQIEGELRAAGGERAHGRRRAWRAGSADGTEARAARQGWRVCGFAVRE